MNPSGLTKEQQADIEARVAEFKKDFQSIVDKHSIDFYAVPQLVPNETGKFEVVASIITFDKKYLPSPYKAEAKKEEKLIK